MSITCWITNATDTRSTYVILTVFPRQQRLRECNSMLGYMCIACLTLTRDQISYMDIRCTNQSGLPADFVSSSGEATCNWKQKYFNLSEFIQYLQTKKAISKRKVSNSELMLGIGHEVCKLWRKQETETKFGQANETVTWYEFIKN
jgi:hypothetical protein